MLVTDINFSIEEWKTLLKLSGYKIKETATAIFVSPCPCCGAGNNTPHFYINKKTNGLTSYNCTLDKGTRLVNFFMYHYNIGFMEARQKLYQYLNIDLKTHDKKDMEKRKKMYQEKERRRKEELRRKEEFIKKEYSKICSSWQVLKNWLNYSYKQFKKNKPSEDLIISYTENIQRYHYLESVIDEVIRLEDTNKIYKFLKQLRGI